MLLVATGLIIGSVSVASGDGASQLSHQYSRSALTADVHSVKHQTRRCTLETFTVKARSVYRGTRKVSKGDTGKLARLQGCSAKPTRPAEGRVWRLDARASRTRILEALPRDYSAWSRVATCETGGWRVIGSTFPDPLGITRANYEDFGGKPLPVGSVTRNERAAVIRVADRLIHAYRLGIPDQGGCASW